MAKHTFDDFRKLVSGNRSAGGVHEWCILVGFDERGYALFLQKAADESGPMVRVGCRYATLKEIRKHYVSHDRNCGPVARRTAKQMLDLIGIAVDAAKFKGWLPSDFPRFNTAPRKRP